MVVQYPKDGEADWTTDLPPLLPVDKNVAASLTFESYDPSTETRSLLYRSRRPMLCEDYFKMKASFETASQSSFEKLKVAEKTLNQMKDFAKEAPLSVLKKFCADIRNLQLERKWNESPEWHTEQELADAEVVRLQGERRKQKEAAELLERQKASKAPRLLPFEIDELEEKGRAQQEARWAAEKINSSVSSRATSDSNTQKKSRGFPTPPAFPVPVDD
jgi:hypothetical protein